MRYLLAIFFSICTLIIVNYWQSKETGAPPYGESESEAQIHDPYAFIYNWVRPEGPPRVAIQAGHWKNQEVPDELERLKNNTGASGGGHTELEVNLDIAVRIAENLRGQNIQVEILPTTIPPRYWADVFVAIHADGSTDISKSGYKFSGPWRDYTNKSDKFVEILSKNYEEDTGLEFDPNITRNMRGYYAFSWWRYEHALHPMTTAVIAETGFITNRNDRALLVNNSQIVADSIADSIVEYLKLENLI